MEPGPGRASFLVLVTDVAEAIWLATGALRQVSCILNLVGDVRPCAREYITILAVGARPRISAFTLNYQSVACRVSVRN